MHLSKFVIDSKNGYVEIGDEKCEIEYKHELLFMHIPNMKFKLSDAKRRRVKPCIDGTLESNKKFTEEYIQIIIDFLNERFLGFHLFNATKLFSLSLFTERQGSIETFKALA